MLGHTREKLQEAEFFYRKFADLDQRIMCTEPEARRYYLSALLSAARSVSDVMRAEEGEKYLQWWQQRRLKLSDEQKDLLKFTNKQRTLSVHVLGADAAVTGHFVSAAELAIELHQRGGTLEIWPGVPGTPAPQVMRTTIEFTRRGEAASVTCRRYLDLLSELISEYVQHIAAPGDTLRTAAPE